MNPLPTSPYSYTWACSVIDRLVKAHARGTEILCKLLEITPQSLAHYLANADPLWNELKNCIHLMDRLGTSPAKYYTDDVLYANLQAFCQRIGYERILKRLDDLGKFTTIEERVQKTGREPKATDSLSPSLPVPPPTERKDGPSGFFESPSQLQFEFS